MSTYRGSPVASAVHNRKDDTYSLLNGDGEIIAVLKRHEYLSQPQLRTLRLSNGKHRRPRAAFRGSPAGQPYLSLAAGAVFYSSPGATWRTFGEPEPPKPIEDAGIRAGEVVAHRCWRVLAGDKLHSAYKKQHEWLPGQPMTGDVRREYGVHAFKAGEHLEEYIEGLFAIDARPGSYIDMWSGGRYIVEATPIAVGTISLWGEIIEHEFGYRAEFGKIRSIDLVLANSDPDILDRLRTKYSLASGIRET